MIFTFEPTRAREESDAMEDDDAIVMLFDCRPTTTAVP
jgi:hypothetical protein